MDTAWLYDRNLSVPSERALHDGPLYRLSLNGTMIYKMNIVLLYKVKLEIETINVRVKALH